MFPILLTFMNRSFGGGEVNHLDDQGCPDTQQAVVKKDSILNWLVSIFKMLFAQNGARFHVFVAHLSLGAGSPHDPSRAVQRVVA